MDFNKVSLPVNQIEFAQDTEERRKWFRAASFSHPAKMVLGLQIYLIEHYTKPGDTILDPMAGSGTVLIACALGRNVVLVELEDKFVKMQEANWQKIKSLGPMLGCQMGQATILQGDSRRLPELLVDKCIFSPPYGLGEGLGHGEKTKSKLRAEKYRSTTYTDKVDKIVTSPPYADQTPAQDRKWLEEHKHEITSNGKAGVEFGPAMQKPNYQPNNISSLPYGEISAVISSPPYEGTITGKELPQSEKSIERKSGKEKWGKHLRLGQSQLTKYADAILTSPPYEKRDKEGKGKHREVSIVKYSDNQENIGNLKSENYLQAMLSVYQNCHKILKAEGLLCLVVKNFIKDKKIVRLDLDTIKLCEKAGFVLKERLARKLTHQSFWRIIYAKRFPDAPKIEFEDVLIFAKARTDGK